MKSANPEQQALVVQPEKETSTALAPMRNDTGQVMGMIQRLSEQGVTAESAAAMREMVALYKEVRAMDAEQQFNAAFVKLQAEMPKVQAVRAVMEKAEKGGGLRYRFAPLEDIMDQIGPFLKANNFSASFTMEYPGNRTVGVCVLRHVAGHKSETRFAVSQSPPPGTSPAQGDGSTGEYAKRYALCAALNIVVSKLDDDARLDGVPGDFVTTEQAEELENRVRNCGRDTVKFLKLAGARTFQEIPKAKYSMLDQQIKVAEAKKVEALKERPSA